MKTGSISAGFFLAKNTAHQLQQPNRVSRPENTRIEYSIRRGDMVSCVGGLYLASICRSRHVNDATTLALM